MVWQGDGSLPDIAEPHLVPSPTLPSTEDVIRKTEQITKNIQELLRAAQENKHDRYALQLNRMCPVPAGLRELHSDFRADGNLSTMWMS